MIDKEQKKIYKKIENILRSYKKYEGLLQKKLDELKNITVKNVPYHDETQKDFYLEVKSELDRVNEIKTRIGEAFFRIEEALFRIDSALEMIQDYEYFNFIEMSYFKKMTYEDIAEELNVSVKTIYKIRNSILEALEFHFKIQRLI